MKSKFDNINVLNTEVGNSIRGQFLQKQINDEVGSKMELDGKKLKLLSKTGKILSEIELNLPDPPTPPTPEFNQFIPHIENQKYLTHIKIARDAKTTKNKSLDSYFEELSEELEQVSFMEWEIFGNPDLQEGVVCIQFIWEEMNNNASERNCCMMIYTNCIIENLEQEEQDGTQNYITYTTKDNFILDSNVEIPNAGWNIVTAYLDDRPIEITPIQFDDDGIYEKELYFKYKDIDSEEYITVIPRIIDNISEYFQPLNGTILGAVY